MRRSRLDGLTALTIGLVLLAATAASPALGQEPASPAPATRDYSWVPVVAPADGQIPDPPDGKWLADDTGREYTLFRWEKHPGYYRLDDDERSVRLRGGTQFEVEHQDERYLYLRWYRTAPLADAIAAARASAADREYRPIYRDVPAAADRLRLEPWDEGLPRAGQWRNGFAVADFDGDGRLDLAHGPPRKGPIPHPVVFLGDGAGRWRSWDAARFPELPYDYGDVAAGDLDGDGAMDLVVASHQRGFFALHGDGKGRFESRSRGLPLRHPATSSPDDRRPVGGAAPGEAPPIEQRAITSRAISLADWNGDGRLDILAMAEGPTASRDVERETQARGTVVFVNRVGVAGAGADWQPLSEPGDLIGNAILPADLDRDGLLDFVTDSRTVGSADLLNYGAEDGGWTAASLPVPHPRLIALAVAVADFDADRRPDVALAFKSRGGSVAWHGLDVFFGIAPRAWRRAAIHGAPDRREGDEITALAAGDLDGDGDADLVALAGDGTARLMINDGRGDFALDPTPEADPALQHTFCSGYSAALVDLDRDGRPELVAGFAGEPGSEVLLGAPKRCSAEGALRVWKVAR